ncbi:hypothetical protein P280DRAFT_468550 [Massarina eburnea CBS 473.64]|uniref:DUF8004 domain-containing protein n=1 Tax=Massarina eburnea CBS 473.64 TaxID=1395130 RepID=A0A6A6S4R5_9PLEO|nr:hypothetical protein P280DRAFT_468550 [Massarina eburnea CBS 473.64]
MSNKMRSSHRLSSLFSSSSADSNDTASVTSSSAGSGPNRLSKFRNRVSSAAHLSPDYPPPPSKYPPSPGAPPTIQAVDSAPSLLEPPPSLDTLNNPRSRSSSPSRLNKSRPTSMVDSSNGMLTPIDTAVKKARRTSRLFGLGKTSEDSVAEAGAGEPPLAWVVGHSGKVSYNLTMLLNGEVVPELWDDQGDTFVYLYPRTSTKGPSFRIDSSAYASSQFMTRLVHGRLYSESASGANELPDRAVRSSSGTFPPSRTGSPDASVADSSDGSKGSRALSDVDDDHTERHLYMPIALSTDQAPITPGGGEPKLSPKDVDTLIAYRNFFAFLVGQSLVATARHSNLFDIFLRISDILSNYNFSNVDGSTFGEVAQSSFDSYIEELTLADVRNSREKTIEAIVLGEKMRSMPLYTEGFVHAVGKYHDIKELRHPKYELITQMTATRMARAALDLENREQNIKNKLKDFEFQAMFAGLMNSAMSEERKLVRFNKWKNAFMNMRSFTLDHLKTKFGSWLPKARSKKNDLTTDGLNRLVLQEFYRDLVDLYDLLVDRTNLTDRTQDGFMNEELNKDFESVATRALRMVLCEYDRSTPPVQPPIPFDVPMFPSLKSLGKNYPSGDKKADQKARGKKVKKEDIATMIKHSHNEDAEKVTPFLDAFRHWEKKQSSGCTMEELWEQRAGQWLFLYAVIQSLPMLTVDAPGLRFTDGVEYFLCEVPRSGTPWCRDDSTHNRRWFGVDGGSKVVSLPTDVVDHGVDGVFRRSHCWTMATVWAQNDTMLSAAMNEMNAAPLPPPPGFLDPAGTGDRSRSQSPDRRRESVMNLGLEALPLPPGVNPPAAGSPSLRPQSSHDPTKTFDSILGSLPDLKNKKKKK